MKTIDKVAWLHLREGKLLSTRSRGKDRYYIPGGKREAGETDVQTLVREIKEELTVDLDVPTLHPMGIFEGQAHGHPPGVMVVMSCYSGQYSGTLQPAAEIEEVVWLRYQDRLLVSPVDQKIFDWLLAQQLLTA
ncbi:MAG TPA: NUDIX domain-containing protein [Hymenobacter sp.]|jgi:8-oxo-dGTP pyrophosphatase MutT (NUDIX family)